MKKFLSLIAALAFLSMAYGTVPEKSVDATVMVTADENIGTGVVFHNGKRTFIWTAAHVLTGDSRDVTLKQPIVKDGKHIGETNHCGKIIRLCSKGDIAVIEANDNTWLKTSVKFAQKRHVPKIGSHVWHVGSMQGEAGISSLFKGYISFNGRTIDSYYFDQVQVTAHVGCSGGGIFNADNGECIGLMVRFLISSNHTPNAMLIVPTRRLWEFSKENDCLWAMDNTVDVPNEVHSIINGVSSQKKMPPAK